MPNTASASVLPWTCAMPQSSRMISVRMASCLQRAAPTAALGDVVPMTTNKSARITECRKWISPFTSSPSIDPHRPELPQVPRGCEIDTQLQFAKVYHRRNRWLLQWVDAVEKVRGMQQSNHRSRLFESNL